LQINLHLTAGLAFNFFPLFAFAFDLLRAKETKETKRVRTLGQSQGITEL
jgi:hypothetical protein